MNPWVAISLIAIAPAAAGFVYFVYIRPNPSAPPMTADETIKASLWTYAISFVSTAIIWGLIDAYLNGYGDGDIF